MMKRSNKRSAAIYPGTFDPITYGHLDLIDRALKIFDKVIIGVAASKTKQPLFSLSERIDMIKKALVGRKNVEVQPFGNLVVSFAGQKKSWILIRGIRMLSDFENEFQMALTNRRLDPRIETMFLMPNESYSYLTSRLIKEISVLGGDVSSYVPAHVYLNLKRKFSKKR